MPNRIITAAVSGEKIKLSNRLAGASGSHNAVSLSLTFDSAWDGTTKKIYFFDRDGENPVFRLLTADLLVNGAYIVPIPSEPLAKSGDMTITIRGVEMAGETAERIIMSASTTMKVDEAVTPDSDVAPIEPTPTQAEQLQGQIDAIINEVTAIPDSVQAAQNSATAAAGSATAADSARVLAETARTGAEAARDSAQDIVDAFDSHAASLKADFNSNAAAANTTIDGKVTIATNAATAAQTAQGLSEGARDASVTAKNEAVTAKTAAETAQVLAQTAKTGADTAKAGAETARTGAESARDTAVTAKNDAVAAKNDAQSAQTAAETAKSQAETAKTGAETAATTAGNRALDSEAFGAGTRNGVAVGTGDPAYQNNAKWYKDQAGEIVGGDFATKTEAQGYVNTHDASETAHSALFGNKVDKVAGKGLSTEDYTTAEKTKLAGVATGANNYTHPANHPPSIITQDASNRFVTDVEKTAWSGKLDTSQKGVANGVASLDGTGKVPTAQLPQVGLLPQIIVATTSGATVTATSGGKTVTGTATGGTCTLDIPTFGTWLVTATSGGKSLSETVIADTVKIYEIDLSFYSVYGFTINEAESNSIASITYTDKATAFSKGSVAWDTSPLFASIKPCLFKDGVVVGYLQRNDYTKFENGTAADITSGSAGDVMVEIPKMAYYMEKSGNIITCKVLIGDVDAKTVDARYSYLPFSRDNEGDRDKIYIGAYIGYSLSSKLRSLSGKTPTAEQTIGAFRTLAQANGTGYQQLPFYQLTLLQILYIMKYGSLDSQTALGRGYVDENAAATATGGTNAKGFCFGETTGKQQMKIFGIEDFWGNLYQWIDGLYCNSSWTILTTYKSFNDTGSGYLFSNSSGNSANTSGYMAKAQGGTQTGFNIKAGAGSESTYFADSAALYADCLPCFGGHWANSSYAGAFRLDARHSASSANASIGARLCYI